MGMSDLDDQTILNFYNHIRSQVEAERGLQHELMTSDAVSSALQRCVQTALTMCADGMAPRVTGCKAFE
jgi:hypothetical protein